MSREIKFRAWHDITKVMLPWRDLLCGYSASSMFENAKHYSLNIMQYTGLKDKNGKEIYEGDILHVYEDEFLNHSSRHLVVFREAEFAFSPPTGLESCGRNGLKYLSDNMFSDYKMEIIGNIHENPELLEAQSERY